MAWTSSGTPTTSCRTRTCARTPSGTCTTSASRTGRSSRPSSPGLCGEAVMTERKRWPRAEPSTSGRCTPRTTRWAAQRTRPLRAPQRGVSIWVVEAEAITASSPSEKDPFFAPSGDELHRRQTHARRGRDRTPRLRSARAGPAAADRPRVRVPAVRGAGARGALPLRPHGLHRAAPLPGLPRALRAHEGTLMPSLRVTEVERLRDDAVARGLSFASGSGTVWPPAARRGRWWRRRW